MDDDLRDLLLSTFEEAIDAQLRAVRRLRRQPEKASEERLCKGLSQVDMAYDILKKARTPLHVSEILDRIQAQFGVTVDRESLVSSLSKKVAIWQRCQISRLFHEDAQGAQVIHLSILPR